MPLLFKPVAAIGAVVFTSVFLPLMFLGDFTGYAYSPESDVIVSRLPAHVQFLYSTVSGVVVAVLSLLLLRICNGIRPKRPAALFAILAPQLSAICFFFGSYKTLLGGPDNYVVKYDSPYGMERLIISLVVGAIASAGITLILGRVDRSRLPTLIPNPVAE